MDGDTLKTDFAILSITS